MGIIAQDQITLTDLTDISYTKTWYRLATSAPSAPSNTHTSGDPTGTDAKLGWVQNEPPYDSDYHLYTVIQNVFGDGSCVWGLVQLSSFYNVVSRAVESVDEAIVARDRYYYEDIQENEPAQPIELNHPKWTTDRPTYSTSKKGYIWYSNRTEKNNGDIDWSPVGHIVSSANLTQLQDSIISTVESNYIDANGYVNGYKSTLLQTAEAFSRRFDVVEGKVEDAAKKVTTFIHEGANGIVVGQSGKTTAAYINAENASFDVNKVTWSSSGDPTLGDRYASFGADTIELGVQSAKINFCGGSSTISTIDYTGDYDSPIMHIACNPSSDGYGGFESCVMLTAVGGDPEIYNANTYIRLESSYVPESDTNSGSISVNSLDGLTVFSGDYATMGFSGGEFTVDPSTDSNQYGKVSFKRVSSFTINGNPPMMYYLDQEKYDTQNCKSTGVHMYSADVVHKPGTTTTAGLLLALSSAYYTHQLAFRNNANPSNGPMAYIRMMASNGNWSDWHRLLTYENDASGSSPTIAAYNHTHTGYVPSTRTVNSKALSSNISLTYSDVGAASSSHTHNYVPTTRTVNSKALSSNISLTYSDVGAASSSHTHSKLTNGSMEVLVNNEYFRSDGADGVLYCGGAKNRWKKVYAADGTIGTSDAKEKDVLGNIEFAEQLILSLEPIKFMWKNGDHRRTRMGFIAQDVSKLCKSLGQNLALYTASYITNKNDESDVDYLGEEVDDEKLTWGLSYDQLIAPIVAVIQSQNKRITELEKIISSLKTE